MICLLFSSDIFGSYIIILYMYAVVDGSAFHSHSIIDHYRYCSLSYAEWRLISVSYFMGRLFGNVMPRIIKRNRWDDGLYDNSPSSVQSNANEHPQHPERQNVLSILNVTL